MRGGQPSTHVGDGNLGHQEVLGPTNPNSLVRPAENVVRASSSEERTGGNTGLPTPQPQRSDSSRPISGGDVTIPPASESHSHQDLSRRDRDAELEIVAQRAAEQVVAMLEQRYGTNREQTAVREERRAKVGTSPCKRNDCSSSKIQSVNLQQKVFSSRGLQAGNRS